MFCSSAPVYCVFFSESQETTERGVSREWMMVDVANSSRLGSSERIRDKMTRLQQRAKHGAHTVAQQEIPQETVARKGTRPRVQRTEETQARGK